MRSSASSNSCPFSSKMKFLANFRLVFAFFLLSLLTPSAFACVDGVDCSWACTSADTPATTCCDFVPSFFEIHESADCADYRPLVSIALGLGDSSSSSSVAVSSSSFCSSVCASRISSLTKTYSSIPLSGRLCPQVQDGLWRLNMICDKDGSGNFCFETYASITRSLDGLYKNRIYSEKLCNSSCLRVILDAAVFQSSRIEYALATVVSSSSVIPELENALRRARALSRFANLVCSVDENGDFCATRLGLFTRSAGLFSRPLDIDDVSEESSRRMRRRLQDDLEKGDDVQSSDSLTRLFDPRQRPGFSCSHCGRVVTSAITDLSEALGLTTITTASAFSISKLRSFTRVGECGIHNGMTCIEKYATNISTTSTTIAIRNVASNCKSEMRDSFSSSCSSNCKNALDSATEVLGCCFKPILRLRLTESSRGELSSSTMYNSDNAFDILLSRNLANQCGITPPPSCRAQTRKFFATSFANIQYSWANAFPTRMILLSEALFKDFAYLSGAPSSVFSLHSAEPHYGMTIFITAITSESNASTSHIYKLIKSSTSTASATSSSFPHLSAAIFALSVSTDFMPTPPILRATDETESFAPADESIHDAEPTQKTSSATPSSSFLTFNVIIATIAMASLYLG